ncbi:hypothetical protein [Gimesia panareensis]|uniref:hypothetical protein n=1 Tax=Gimesia panareensis TaxID=2527978 RepID=UPI0011A3223B|nr:hypothetical protein [Gimesia panareensis]
MIHRISPLELVDYKGNPDSLNNRKIVADQQAGIDKVPIARLSLHGDAVLSRFHKQVRDGFIDDGTKSSSFKAKGTTRGKEHCS